MTLKEHQEIHVLLHQKLSELVMDFHQVTKIPLDENLKLKDFFQWSLSQTTNPTSATAGVDELKKIEEASPDKNENEKILNSQILITPPLLTKSKSKVKKKAKV